MTSFSPSHLDVIERRFLALTAGSRPLALDCAALGCGLPQRDMPLDEVRVLLLRRRTSWVSKDAVWQELVRRARAVPEPWTTVAAGMMMPGPKHIAGKLGSRFLGDRDDLDSEILEGFLQALDIADERAPRISRSSTGPRSAAAMRRATTRGDRRCPAPSSSTPLTFYVTIRLVPAGLPAGVEPGRVEFAGFTNGPDPLVRQLAVSPAPRPGRQPATAQARRGDRDAHRAAAGPCDAAGDGAVHGKLDGSRPLQSKPVVPGKTCNGQVRL